ncbi:MAG: hypothetical protein ABJA71_03780 [Ginsengibacter sp.]
MKQIKIIAFLNFFILSLMSCSNNEHRYIDLNTGKRINVIKDSSTGYWVNAETKEPLVVYYDSKTKDTLYGKTGEVVNNKVVTKDGKYYYESEAEKQAKELKEKPLTQDEIDRQLLKQGDYKKKVEKDGDIKIKSGDTKIKIDGETGEKTVKKR